MHCLAKGRGYAKVNRKRIRRFIDGTKTTAQSKPGNDFITGTVTMTARLQGRVHWRHINLFKYTVVLYSKYMYLYYWLLVYLLYGE